MPSSEHDQVLVIDAPGQASIHRAPRPESPPDNAFDVATVYSGLSAGTELAFYKGTHPNLSSTWDPDLGLFHSRTPTQGYPVTRWGYMQVGRITASTTPGLNPGALVAMTYGHRSAYRANPLTDRAVPLPDDLDPVLGIYAAHMGPICANGVLHAAADYHGPDVRSLSDGVQGRRIAITGAGPVALLTALFARHHGAQSIAVIDPTPARRTTAESLGFETLDPTTTDPALDLKRRWRHAPGDRGADLVFQCRGQASSLALALRMLRPQGSVIDLAFYQRGAEEVHLGQEFHHNGLSVRCAQIGRVPRGLGHLWDRERLSAETLSLLRAEGAAIMKNMITDILPIEEAPRLLAELAGRRREVGQVVFTFGSE
jgi:threonine dehydrogenase-like Zn-dependent dehydrogenase